MQQQQQQQPAAAPGSAGGHPGSAGGAGASPPSPLPPIPGSQLESESSGSAASSAMFPTSCSPQLPFAFTPSAQSLASYGSSRGPSGLLAAPGEPGASPRALRRTTSPSAAAASAAASPRGNLRSSPQAQAAGPQGAGAAATAAGGGTLHVQFSDEVVVTGQEVSTSAVLARRASWSGRSSALHLRSGSVGYSISPMQVRGWVGRSVGW